MVAVGTAIEARARFRQIRPDIVVLDPRLPDVEGFDLISEFRSVAPDIRIIVTTSDNSTRHIVATMRAGAFDILVKPVREAPFISAIEDALASLAKSRPAETPHLVEMIGTSKAFLDVSGKINAAGQSSAPVFLTGESGAGKTLAAQHIHEQSERASGAFVTVDCATVESEGFERALDGFTSGGLGSVEAAGTLFLDHICQLDFALQTRLLHALEKHTAQSASATGIQVPRLICATNRDPLQEIQSGRLRADLFYRLNVAPIRMPALRDREQDVLLIADQSISALSRAGTGSFTGMSSEARNMFLTYGWPGNITELLNVIRSAAIMHDADLLTPDMLPDPVLLAGSRAKALDPLLDKYQGMTLAELERHIIKDALARTDGSIPSAARRLKVSPSTLYRKLEAWAKADDAP